MASGVLVTLRDCHLLDVLVIGSVEARVKLVRGSREALFGALVLISAGDREEQL